MFFSAYTCLLLAILPLQSLWLDELMQTAASRDLPLGRLLGEEIPRTAGQVPLAYLLQKLSISWLGYSTFSARLPAALMGIVACAGFYKLAKQAGVRCFWIGMAIFVTLPLQLRYDTEARPYSQALCICIWLSVLCLRMRDEDAVAERPVQFAIPLYTFLCVCGLYTQPFTLFVPAAHVAYAVIVAKTKASFTLLRQVLLATSISVLLFLPWYFFARTGWRSDVNASNLHFHWHAKLPLELLRELTGAGYLETSLLLVLSAYALRSGRLSGLDKRFWALCAFLPGGLALVADATFDYFFAVRQLIFVLPPFIILAAFGLDTARRNGKARIAFVAAALLITLNIGYSIRWFTKPREDWGRAAALLDDARAHGACLVFLPAGSVRFYSFFVPGIRDSSCNLSGLSGCSKIYLAVSPYLRDPGAEQNMIRQLRSKGFLLTATGMQGEPHVLIFRRRSKD